MYNFLCLFLSSPPAKAHVLYLNLISIIGMEPSDPNMLENMISHGYKIAVFPKPAFVVTGTKLSTFIE